MSPHNESGLKKAVFTLATVAILFGLVEIGFTIYDRLSYFPKVGALMATNTAVDVRIVQNFCFRSRLCRRDHDLIWRMKPGAQSHGFTLNNKGLRGSDIPAEKAPGEYRIVVVGGSHPFGIGVGDEHPYAALLESRLGEFLSDTHQQFRVINAAIPGYSSLQARRMVERDPYELKADLYIVDVGLNDTTVLWSEPDSVIAGEGAMKVRAQDFLYGSATYWNLREFLEGDPVQQNRIGRRCMPEETVANLSAIGESAHKRGAKVVYLTQMAVEPSRSNPAARELVNLFPDMKNAPLVDIYAVFKARESEIDRLLPDGVHGSPEGHRLIADTIAQALAQHRDWWIDGPRTQANGQETTL